MNGELVCLRALANRANFGHFAEVTKRGIPELTLCVVLERSCVIPRNRTRKAHLRRVDGRFVDQHNGYIVPNRIDPAALTAFKALFVSMHRKRLFTSRTDENL